MRTFTIVLSWLAVFGSALLAGPVQAEVNVDWGVTISSGTPPPPRVRNEPMPPPRSDFVWVNGYWRLGDGAYLWMPGRWEPARAGYIYNQPAWREGPRGWDFQPGGWHRGHEGHDKEQSHGREHGPGHCPPGHRRKGEC
jgi:hypothetical protein